MSKKIDINQAVKYLSHEGPLAKENPDFEERTAQLELVKNISECFNENKIGVFEAGTGVGKSFAYLIPLSSYILLRQFFNSVQEVLFQSSIYAFVHCLLCDRH